MLASNDFDNFSLNYQFNFCLKLCDITTGQCEFSFAKTAVIMEMNKKEMDRYDSIYK